MWETTFYGPTMWQKYKMMALQGSAVLDQEHPDCAPEVMVRNAEAIADVAVAGDKKRKND